MSDRYGTGRTVEAAVTANSEAIIRKRKGDAVAFPNISLPKFPWWADHNTPMAQIEEWRNDQRNRNR